VKNQIRCLCFDNTFEHEHLVYVATCAPNKKNRKHELQVWSVKNVKCTKKFKITSPEASSCMLIHQHKLWIACGSNLLIYDTNNWSLLHTIEAHKATLRCMLSAGGNVWTGSDDHTIKIWVDDNGKVSRVTNLKTHKRPVLHMCSDGNNHVWSSSVDKKIILWDAKEKKVLRWLLLQQHVADCRLVLVTTQDQKRVLWCGALDGSISVWKE